MKNILEYLENTAPKFADKIAIADDTAELTFAQLITRAKAGGSGLLKKGLKKEPVVVFLPKEPDTVSAFFAVIYAGCYYVPVEIGMPLHRIRMILQKLEPSVILCNEETAAVAGELGYGDRVVLSAELLAGEADETALAEVRKTALDIDPIYIVFTSGSTGMPKGVTACHRSLIDYAEALCPVIGSNSESVFAVQVPLYVDACMKEILSVIRCGAQAWLMPQSLFMSPLRALEFLNNHKINTLCWVASALTMLSGLGAFDEGKPEYLHTVCFGSEVFPVRQLHMWQQAAPGARFINLYGPTECTGMSFHYEVNRPFEEGQAIPVGVPFDNTGFFLLKEDGTEAAPGETGEICIRGTAVTLGYYDDPERTAAAFVQNPLNTRWPETIYKTGDLGYLNEFGELVFASRKDSQIKNMGHRIELGEIEMCATTCPGVENACCIWDPEKKKLALFYMGTAEVKQLQAHFRKELPRHMIPTKLYPMETLPMLPNGKLDRRQLFDTYKASK